MQLPTVLRKTWNFSVNNVIGAQSTATLTNASCMWLTKELLIGHTYGNGTGGSWTVTDSTDGSGTAPAGTDTWLSAANIIGAVPGVAHSWIVLRQTGIATNFEVCIDNQNASSGALATVVISPSVGFSGGTATARPTASDEIVLITGANWGGIGNATNANCVIHALQSTDGTCTRIFFCNRGIVCGLLLFDKPRAPVTGWTNPSASVVLSNGVTTITGYSTLIAGAGIAKARGVGGATMSMCFTTEVVGPGSPLPATFTRANPFSGAYPTFCIGLACLTAPSMGRHASIFDMWLTCVPVQNGDTLGTTRTFAVFGNLVVPWNGTTLLTAG